MLLNHSLKYNECKILSRKNAKNLQRVRPRTKKDTICLKFRTRTNTRRDTDIQTSVDEKNIRGKGILYGMTLN